MKPIEDRLEEVATWFARNTDNCDDMIDVIREGVRELRRRREYAEKALTPAGDPHWLDGAKDLRTQDDLVRLLQTDLPTVKPL